MSEVGNIIFISLDDEEAICEMSLSVFPALAIVLVDSLPICELFRFAVHESVFFQSSSVISILATRIRRSGQIFGGSIAALYEVSNSSFLLLYYVFARHTLIVMAASSSLEFVIWL